MAEENVFAAGKARQKKLLVRGAVAVVCASIAIVGGVWVRSAVRVLNANRDLFYQLHNNYCAIAKVMAKTSDRTEIMIENPGGVRIPWLVSLHGGTKQYLGASNAELVELPELEWLCAAMPKKGSFEESGFKKRVHGDVFASTVANLFDQELVDYFRQEGITDAVPFLRDLRFLVVLELKHYKQSTAHVSNAEGTLRDPGEMDAGGFSAVASVFRLSDAKLLSTVNVSGSGPGAAIVSVRRGASVAEAMDNNLRFESERAFRRAIEQSFGRLGIELRFSDAP
ncbi:MAG: hypothetical protein KBF88_09090 [Polyangiaceae bacterium]|nr:hypothetical protein [Polyangiaceae bacterium]